MKYCNDWMIRETLLVDSALAISAYVAIARKMHDLGVDLRRLERLGQIVTATVRTPVGDEEKKGDG